MGLIGIKPTHPATGYGYVELGAPVAGAGLPKGFRKVRRFVEKPDAETAARIAQTAAAKAAEEAAALVGAPPVSR